MNDELPPSIRVDLPHAKWLQAMTVITFIGFTAVTAWVLKESNDQQTKGILVGAWITLATAVNAFWFGSSSGGKRKS